MSAVTITVKTDRRGERELGRAESVEEITERSIRFAFFELGRELKQVANAEILRKPKGGRVYIIRGPSGRRRRHVASAPGETHANLSGRLRRSISWKVHGSESMDFGYGVSTTGRNAAPDYDEFVEFGTRRMDARPSLGNAVDSSASRRVEQDFGADMDRAFREFL